MHRERVEPRQPGDHTVLEGLLNIPRPAKQAISVAYDIAAIALVYFISLALRMGAITIPDSTELLSLGLTVVLTIAALNRLGLYRAILRFIGREAIIRILIAAAISSTLLITFSFFLHARTPRSVPLIHLFTTFFLIGVPRLLIRNLYQITLSRGRQAVIIYGADYTGTQLALQLNLGTQFKSVAYIDDNPQLQGTTIEGLPVSAPHRVEELISKYNATRVLLALGNVPHSRRKSIIDGLEKSRVKVQTVPPIADILSGKAKLQEIRDIDISDLLGRSSVPPRQQLMDKCITGKVVMVTGAGGSIGAELCRQIIQHKPDKLVLFELNEFALYSIEQELLQYNPDTETKIISLLGSVQNRTSVETIMRTCGVQTLYHAAAYKHVPLVEHNIVEGIRNNVFGTFHTAEAAIAANVETFILVSTDKAVRPTNIMGASKRMAELLLQALQTGAPNTRFAMVRFGNALGSSGSVVPLFREQIKKGGPITVTHPDIIRYFMTITEAAQLVIQAGSMAQGGEVFVLDMGEPVKIIDMARKMIHLSGLSEKDAENASGDIEIIISGLRPGEKLFEELLIGDNVSGTDHPRIMMAQETCLSWDETRTIIQQLDDACLNFNCDKIQETLIAAPTGFHQEHAMQDSVWLQRTDQVKKKSLNVVEWDSKKADA